MGGEKAHFSSFAVQVFCDFGDNKGKWGSGFYITEGRILTAAHVMAEGEDGNGPLRRRARVRLQATRNKLAKGFWGIGGQRGGGWAEATRIWPVGDAFPEADLVVLQVGDKSFAARDLFSEADWRWRLELDLAAGEYQDVCLAGYPQLSASFSEKSAEFQPLLTLKGDLQDLDAPNSAFIDIASPTPKNASDWSKMSGSAVILGDRDVIGLISKATDRVEGNRVMLVQRLWPLKRHSDFCDLLRPVIRTRGGIRKGPAPIRPEMVDRLKEVSTFGTAFSEQWAKTPMRHFVFVQGGHERDDLANSVFRYSEDVVKAQLKLSEASSGVYGNPAVISLSTPEDTPQERLQTALLMWAQRLDTKLEGWAPPDRVEEVILANAVKADVPHLIMLQHEASSYDRECSAVICDFLSILARVPPTDPPLIIFINVCTGYECTPVEMPIEKTYFDDKRDLLDLYLWPMLQKWIKTHAWPDAKTDGAINARDVISLDRLNHLSDCQPSHVTGWINKIRAQHMKKIVVPSDSKDNVDKLMAHAAFPQRTAIDTLQKLTWEDE